MCPKSCHLQCNLFAQGLLAFDARQLSHRSPSMITKCKMKTLIFPRCNLFSVYNDGMIRIQKHSKDLRFLSCPASLQELTCLSFHYLCLIKAVDWDFQPLERVILPLILDSSSNASIHAQFPNVSPKGIQLS